MKKIKSSVFWAFIVATIVCDISIITLKCERDVYDRLTYNPFIHSQSAGIEG